MTLRSSARPVALLAAFLLACIGASLGQAACVPPDAMMATLKDNPDAAAYTDLGVWYADQKQYSCAADAFATSLQMDPNQKGAGHVAFMFGVSLYFSGNTKDGITALEEAEQVGYNSLELHTVLAGALEASHSTKEAEDEWRAALAFDPESTNALDALSNDLMREGDFAGTITLLEVPRLVGQRSPQQSLNLGAAYAATGRLEEAARVLRDGLNTTPDSAALADRLAGVLVQLNRKDEAAAVLELSVEEHPDDARMHEALGVVLAQINDMPGAKAHFERAIALGDNSAEAKANLAKAVEALGAAK
jgi:tetratricopeptide (TPR) repeat protein